MADVEPVKEEVTQILDRQIGYCRYGHGPNKYLFIPGGVGCYRKDYPESMLRAFDPEKNTIVCIDPPGYGTSSKRMLLHSKGIRLFKFFYIF